MKCVIKFNVLFFLCIENWANRCYSSFCIVFLGNMLNGALDLQGFGYIGSPITAMVYRDITRAFIVNSCLHTMVNQSPIIHS